VSEHAYIPVSKVVLGADIEASVLEVLRSGVIAQGPVVARLESEFAAMVGVPHCVAVNNGTTALIAALDVLDLQPGDEVITSPFTFVATINAALAAGATVRFADISIDDFAIDPACVQQAIGPRSKVVMPVHLYGQMADMRRLAPLAADHGLAMVEDAAQSHGATLDGRQAGSWGIGCFSLYATKNLTSGEGGLITTSDDAIADRLRVLRNQGMRQRYQYEQVGFNYRLTDLQAAVCLPQLRTYADTVATRRRNANLLLDGLAGLPGLVVPEQLAGREHVWHQFTVLVDDEARVGRDDLAAQLHERGVGSGVYYPAVALDYDCFASHPRVVAGDVPVARRVAASCLSLPVHHHLSVAEVERVVAAVREVLE
jgi:dTDP-4-amino-4,6-dideoxygalactose transaminase